MVHLLPIELSLSIYSAAVLEATLVTQASALKVTYSGQIALLEFPHDFSESQALELINKIMIGTIEAENAGHD